MNIFILLLCICNIFLAKCSELDLKNHKITGKIDVFHGYYGKSGKYRMFASEEDPIEKVYYGPDTICPYDSEFERGTKCLVESFDNFGTIYYRIHIVHNYPNVSSPYSRYDYVKSENKLVRKHRFRFLIGNSKTMYINFDINSDKIHPFIEKTIKTSNGNNIIKYKMKDHYFNSKFGGISTAEYKFGNVYDSTTPIVVGYKIFDSFMQEFDSAKLYYKDNRLEALSCHKDSITLNYVKNDSGIRTLWFAIPSQLTDLIDEEKIAAQTIMNKPELQFLPAGLLTLDVSEVISPSLFEIDKTVGTRGRWYYTLYSVNKKYKQFFKLARIVDSLTSTPVIYTVGDYAIETVVERYSNSEVMLLIVTSIIPGPVGNFKNSTGFVWQNVDLRRSWRALSPQELNLYIVSMERCGPIKINVLIHDEPTSIYSDNISTDENGFYLNMSINEPDGLVIEEGKFVFGNIEDKRLYEEGNIPCDPFKKDIVYLSQNTNTPNVVVTNSTVPRPLCYTDRRPYYTILATANSQALGNMRLSETLSFTDIRPAKITKEAKNT